GPADKLRIGRLTAGKVADFMVATESMAVLLLAEPKVHLAWRAAPLLGVQRAASFAVDRTLNPPECIIGQRFVRGCRRVQLLADGSLKSTEGPKLANTALKLQLVDVNGDGRSDL